MFQRVVVIGYEWRRGFLHLLAIEYGIVVTSRDAETTTTTIALHCLLAFLTLYGESYIQPSVLFVNPSWVLVSTKQPGGLLANFVTVSSRAARVTDSAEQHFFFTFSGQTLAISPKWALRVSREWTIVSIL